METLVQCFKGEESWIKYSNLFGEDWTISNFQMKLLEKCKGKLDIAKVIFYHLGENGLKWMDSSVPALDDLTPLECLIDKKLIN